MISGEFTSVDETYLETTNTASECVTQVKTRTPNADGMTWALNTKECWAKYGSSNSTIDPSGCSYCHSCYFGKRGLNLLISFNFPCTRTIFIDIFY